MTAEQKILNWYKEKFANYSSGLNGQKETSLYKFKCDAINTLLSKGFPSAKDEEWRFTNITPIAKLELETSILKTEKNIERSYYEKYLIKDAVNIVLIDGVYSEKHSEKNILNSVRVENIADLINNNSDIIYNIISKIDLQNRNAFELLNTAFTQNGIYINVSNTSKNNIVQIINIASKDAENYALHPLLIINIDDESDCTINEIYTSVSNNQYLNNVVKYVRVGANSRCENNVIQSNSKNAYNVNTNHVDINSNGNYLSNVISLGGKIIRNNITATFKGEHANCVLNGVCLSKEDSLIDNHTLINHHLPNCNSKEVYKMILKDNARGVFNGKIFVQKDAQKTDAKQTNKTLLLSDNATINTKPQLEIFADDVKCTHGATIGQLDAEQLFYLRSRGIHKEDAYNILVSAFASEILSQISVEQFRLITEQILSAELQ